MMSASRTGRKRVREGQGEGVTGLHALGVREMTYKLAFLACSIQCMGSRFATGTEGVGAGAGRVRMSKRQRLLQEHQKYKSSLLP
jgi:DNA replication licensing factor MCM6